VADAVGELQRHGFLVRAPKREAPVDVAFKWAGSFAAAYYHFATRDVVYVTNPFEWFSAVAPQFAAERQPPLFKDYRDAPFRKLPKGNAHQGSLEAVLRRRRTVREFLGSPVSLNDLAAVVRGSWGMTGRLDAGIFGELLAKTSPSAGARHPIECYILAWNVRGLAPGLYHYSVRRDGLERLGSGDLRDQAVRSASGQAWVGNAAFLCILTAVADRVFWKYPSSDAYRLFLLDAGHLAQTFCLLATSIGLGPFTTAAIQESFIEKLLDIDGVREFPIYLCGAGVPDPSASGHAVETLR
jgi:SagB-type dehydrogenase family enzyme